MQSQTQQNKTKLCKGFALPVHMLAGSIEQNMHQTHWRWKTLYRSAYRNGRAGKTTAER